MEKIKDLIQSIAETIVDHLCKLSNTKNDFPSYSANKGNLSYLHPGNDNNMLVKEYYIKKTSNLLLTFVVMVVLLVLVLISRSTNGMITDDNRLKRNDIGRGKTVIDLTASTEEYDYGVLAVEIEERKLSVEDRDRLMDELYEYLLEAVLSDNDSLDHVDKDLFMPGAIEGYPFSLRWESGDYLLIDSQGKVNNTELSGEGIPVDLKVIMTYGDFERSYDLKAVVYPPDYSPEELKHIKLMEEMDDEDIQTRYDEYFKLPDYIDGKKIVWKEKREPIVPLLIAMTICMMAGIWLGMDRDVKKKCEERDRQLIIDYAEFVSKLQVLITSGSTIRGALEQMLADYKRFKTEGGKRRYVYEELLICMRKLGDGMNEASCYEYFGRRCRVVCYRKLSSLLIQNLKKGSDGLIESLNNEVSIAFEERKAMARRMGEETQTKLIFPMMLMLSVVMIIIMIPAYMSFGGL